MERRGVQGVASRVDMALSLLCILRNQKVRKQESQHRGPEEQRAVLVASGRNNMSFILQLFHACHGLLIFQQILGVREQVRTGGGVWLRPRANSSKHGDRGPTEHRVKEPREQASGRGHCGGSRVSPLPGVERECIHARDSLGLGPPASLPKGDGTRSGLALCCERGSP